MKKSPLIHPYIERILRQIILKDLANKGRPKWDNPHTEAVVHWMKHLLTELNNPDLNSKVLITAAYAHDWGYAGLFSQKKPITIDQARSRKDLHMKKSVEMIERLIIQRLPSYYTQAEFLRLTHLISIHDYVDQLEDEDELLLMECDALGMLEVERVPPTLPTKENSYFMKTSIEGKRLPRFIHAEAKEIAKDLIEKRKKYYQEISSSESA